MEHGYTILLHQDAASGMWIVDIPDLPSVVTEGPTPAEARANAIEAISAYLDVMRERGVPVPPPSAYEVAVV